PVSARPEQKEEFPRFDREIEMVQRRDRSESLGQLLDSDGNHGRRATGRGKVWLSAKSKENPGRRGNRLHRTRSFVSLPPLNAMTAAKKPQPKPRRPANFHPDLESVLFTEAEIKRRVKSLGQELKEV